MNYNYSNSAAGGNILLLLFTLSVCLVVSLGKPSTYNLEEREAGVKPLSLEVDKTRKMWNEAKQAYKKMQKSIDKAAIPRAKRSDLPSSEPTQVPPELANITGSKYMLELYNNITDDTRHMRANTQANTIKFLTFVKKYRKCPHPPTRPYS